MSLDSEVASLAAAVATLTSVAETLDSSTQSAYNIAVASSTTNAATATTRAAAALVSQLAADASGTTATTQASAAAASAASASAYKDLAITAWAASMSPAETLPAISKSLHFGAIVKSIIYDASKDSDGGAWRKRCADKSWYTETLGGTTWTGQYSSIASAWSGAGSLTGAVFQATATAGPLTSGKFYSADSATTATEVFRGITREFPAVAGIVAESARVVIYDLATGAMWMVFVTSYSTNPRLLIGTANTSITAGQGKVLLGGGAFGITIADFAADSGTRVNAVATYRFPALISSRNVESVWPTLSSVVLVNSAVNDVALTVLDTAPIDPGTLLPVPCIAIATAGGVSVIKDDGTVVNSAATAIHSHIAFDPSKRVLGTDFSNGTIIISTLPVSSMAASWVVSRSYYGTAASIPATLAGSFSASALYGANAVGPSNVCINNAAGLTLLKENPATPTKGMVSYITNAYNSGWLPGDIRGAYLADTTAETITASGELVTNGTFASNITGWTDSSVGGGAIAWNAGGWIDIIYTSGLATASQGFTTVIGRTYNVVVGKLGSNLVVNGGTTATGSNLFSFGNNNTDISASFVATTTTSYININRIAAGTGTADNISVKLAEPDRSVKNKGLVINGSLAKTAVASGASLVAYSGFSAANYLEQPYDSDHDYGTGDFSVMGWVNLASHALTNGFVQRGTASGLSGEWTLQTNQTTGYLTFQYQNVATVSSATAVPTGGWAFVGYFRTAAGKGYFIINGVLVNVDTGAGTSLTKSGDKVRVGLSFTNTIPCSGSLALWRISATAPSADQIAHIYRTELPLLQPNAQCTIAGTSTAVTALAYDDVADVLHVGTSYGRSGFRDLLRINSDVTTVGAITSLSAGQGAIVTGGATSAIYYQPAMLLRDELRRKDEARRALGKVSVFFDYTATSSQTAFVLPKGYTAKALYHNGTLKRETTTGVYWTRSTDGFAETCTLSAGATTSDWISIMATRNY